MVSESQIKCIYTFMRFSTASFDGFLYRDVTAANLYLLLFTRHTATKWLMFEIGKVANHVFWYAIESEHWIYLYYLPTDRQQKEKERRKKKIQQRMCCRPRKVSRNDFYNEMIVWSNKKCVCALNTYTLHGEWWMKTMTGIRHNNAPKYHDERSNNENYFNGLLLGTLFPDFSLLGVDEDGDILPSHWRPRFLNLSIGEFSELNFFYGFLQRFYFAVW